MISLQKLCVYFLAFPCLFLAGCGKGEKKEQNQKDITLWKQYYSKAQAGDAAAQYELGVCYEEGKGTSENDKEAVKWYRLAAEKGYAKAQYNLGVCYELGNGIPEDAEEAVKWY